MRFSVIKIIDLSIGLIIIVIFSVTCASKIIFGCDSDNKMAPKEIEKVLKEHTKELMSINGVVGTARGICNNNPCIKVYVIKKTPELGKSIPDILEGYPVMIEETGEFRALPEKQD